MDVVNAVTNVDKAKPATTARMLCRNRLFAGVCRYIACSGVFCMCVQDRQGVLALEYKSTHDFVAVGVMFRWPTFV
jgi:hypothetical protein